MTTVGGIAETRTTRLPIHFYYGEGHVDTLTTYRKVVLQPDLYSSQQLAFLDKNGVQTLCYLSLSEDQGPPAPWHRETRNPDWGGAFVDVAHPRWMEQVLKRAHMALDSGFAGLFLDTLNVELTYPEEIPHLLILIQLIAENVKANYILANRGFGLLPHLVEFVNGILFESFSTRWVADGYTSWPPEILREHDRIAGILANSGIDLYALDYADTHELADFAMRRARRFGMPCVVSDRALSRI